MQVFDKKQVEHLPKKQGDALLRLLKRELDVLKRVRHPNVLALLSPPMDTKTALVAGERNGRQ